MSRQLIVLTAALAVHTAAVVVVARTWDAPPPTAPALVVAAPAVVPPRCQTGAPPPLLRDRWTPTAATPATGITNADLDAGIHMTDATHGLVMRALYDRLVADPMAAAHGVRIVPAFRDGVPEGFKLYAIRPGSLFDRLHFQNGDTIETINGMDLTTPDKAFGAYQTLRRANAIEVELRRAGTRLTISVALVGITPAFLDANIERTDATHVRISQALFALALAQEEALVPPGARIVPAFRDARPEGFKVYAIKPGSVAARLGLENGDTVLSLNHLSFVGSKIPLTSLAALRTAPELDFAIIRHGQPLTLVATPDRN